MDKKLQALGIICIINLLNFVSIKGEVYLQSQDIPEEEISHKSSQIYILQLFKNENEQYYVKGFDVGQQQLIRMMVDINSSFNIISNSTLFNEIQANTTHINSTDIPYMKHIYKQDFKVGKTLEIDFFRQNKTNVIDILYTNYPLSFQGIKIDGILGFSRANFEKNLIFKRLPHSNHQKKYKNILASDNFKTFQDDIYENFNVAKKIFSIYLSPESAEHYSYIIVGEFEANIFKRRTLISTYSTRDYAWSFFIEYLEMGSVQIQFPKRQDTFISLIHNYIGISLKSFELIKNALMQNCNVVSTSVNNEGFLEFQLNVDSQQYREHSILRVHLSKSMYFDMVEKVYLRQCLLSVQDMLITCQTKIKLLEEKDLDDVIILGTPFLQYYYSVYNQETNRITIGMANFSDLEVAQAKFWYYIFVLLIFLFAILLISIGIFYKEEFSNLVLIVKNTIRYICCRDQQSRLELLNIANN
ncbi:eukaryotic aspartyl protease (macronuclear) [Tetrahymena thermophila SB210]|uniref:Eukaryotic aspartyl protease n=1 Tax=Tetrahymena thermophila (strain SB210) TaxID=312017 RepID=Q22A29_TETTS|nr:eukaryotic aspartyl protease [Tetrahymena thermophila SB210]EAR82150.2 eukaryotic aspartyl protease [Tetrahymena thermophila SB210]|eukprot:XP_001029814.2 eukaryotic aspartyl protease [Tetrahymena thermophila SB210]